MHFICIRFCQLCSKLKSVGYGLWGKQFGNDLLCHWHTRRRIQYEDFSVFGCQSEDISEDSKRVEWVQWPLRRYSCSEAPPDHSDKKRTPEFLGETQAIIVNDLKKQINSIARDKGASEFLIRQLVHKDIRYLSYKMRKCQFFAQAMRVTRKDRAVELLNKFKHPI